MNSKASVNPTSIKWLAEDEQIVADYFLGLGVSITERDSGYAGI